MANDIIFSSEIEYQIEFVDASPSGHVWIDQQGIFLGQLGDRENAVKVDTATRSISMPDWATEEDSIDDTLVSGDGDKWFGREEKVEDKVKESMFTGADMKPFKPVGSDKHKKSKHYDSVWHRKKTPFMNSL